MTGGNAPLGRRDNGLHAASYAVVADVDPRVGEHLLEVLGDRGIAAYLKPTATLPHPPLDRLFVDRDDLPAARRVVAEVVGSPDSMLAGENSDLSEEADGSTPTTLNVASTAFATPANLAPAAREGDEFEAAWASIVAGFDHTAPAERPWPSSEDTAPEADRHQSDRPPMPDQPVLDRPRLMPRFVDERTDQNGSSILDGLDTFGANMPDDDDEEDFQPPPPPPLPRLAPITIVGVLGIVLGFLAVVRPEWFAMILPPSTAEILGGFALVLGTVVLVARLRSGSDDDEDPDQGAHI